MDRFYKLAQPDGWDFFTGKAINYRDNIGKIVKVPTLIDPKSKPELCSSNVIHASRNPLDCFVGAKIPCSAFIVEGKPVVEDDKKCGFFEFEVIKEITDLDNLFGFKYQEAINPINPLLIEAKPLTEYHKELLKQWASLWDSLVDSLRASQWNSLWASQWNSLRASLVDSLWDSLRDSLWASLVDSLRASLWASQWNSLRASLVDSLRDSLGAYIGSFFPNIKKWAYIDHEEGIYPFQSCVDLWKDGYIPTFDGKIWRLHCGKDAKIVYEMEAKNE